MTCIVNRSAFADALSSAARVAAQDNAAPVSQCVHLSAVANELTIAASHLTYYLELRIECEGDLAPVCVHASRLAGVVASMLAESVGMRLDGPTLQLASGKGRRTLPTVPVEGFPALEFHATAHATVPFARLREALQFTLPHAASAGDLAKSYAIGVHFFTHEGRLKAMGADGHEIALFDVDEDGGQEIAATLPTKGAEIVLKLAVGNVDLGFSDRGMVADWSGGRLISPILQAPYPTELVLKTLSTEEWGPVTSFEAPSFLRSLQSVGALGAVDFTTKARRVKLTLNGKAILTTASPDGSGIEEFDAACEAEGEIETGFASTRMERVLRGFGDRVLTAHIRPFPAAMKFEAAGLTDRLALLFPMQV